MNTFIAPSASGPIGRFRDSFLAQAWLILLLALVFGSTLAAVHVTLKDTIAANKSRETIGQIPALIWGEDPSGHPRALESVRIAAGTVPEDRQGSPSLHVVYRVTKSDRVAGWVIKAAGQGYAGQIELLIGVDADVNILTGLFVLEQKETPGLGNKITFPAWRKQFTGKSTRTPLRVMKNNSTADNAIDAITGATISSRSVTDIVNATVGLIKGRLDARGALFSERIGS